MQYTLNLSYGLTLKTRFTFQALGKEVQMHEYDDNHPLAKPNHDANVMISAAIFFNDILNR